MKSRKNPKIELAPSMVVGQLSNQTSQGSNDQVYQNPSSKNESQQNHSERCEGAARIEANFERVVLLEQSHALNIRTNMESGRLSRIVGEIDGVPWRDLRILSNTVVSALIKSKQAAMDQINVRAYLVERGGKWVPGFEVMADPDIFKGQHAKEQVQASVNLALNCLLQPAADLTPDLFNNEMSYEIFESVHFAVQEALAVCGGKSMTQPVSFVIDGECEKTIEGRFGAKKTHENFTRESHICKGVLVGFDLDTRELFVKTAEKKVKISFCPDHVDLKQIVDWAQRKVLCAVDTDKTISRNGQDVLSQPLRRSSFISPAS